MKLFYNVLLVATLTLVSCEGEIGPAGPPGEPGQDALLSQVFEVGVDFLPQNDFQALVNIPASIEVYNSDVIIAYVLAGTEDGVDLWEPLPQTLYFEDGILLYGFDYTYQDVQFFIDGTINPTFLDSEWRLNKIFRVAVIPANLVSGIDVMNYQDVMGISKFKGGTKRGN